MNRISKVAGAIDTGGGGRIGSGTGGMAAGPPSGGARDEGGAKGSHPAGGHVGKTPARAPESGTQAGGTPPGPRRCRSREIWRFASHIGGRRTQSRIEPHI